MGFWPDVTKGGKVEHHVGLENDLRHMVNSINGFGANSPRGSAQGGYVAIQVYNAETSALSGGVSLQNNNQVKDGVYPANKYYSDCAVWGVLTSPVSSGGVATCVVEGVYTVTGTITGTGNYITPNVGGGYVRTNSPAGAARILWEPSSGAATILIGHGEGGGSVYAGYFMLRDASEYNESGALVSGAVEVYNGTNSHPDYAGWTNLGGISGGTISVPDDETVTVYAYGYWHHGLASGSAMLVSSFDSLLEENLYEIGEASIETDDDGNKRIVIAQTLSCGTEPLSFTSQTVMSSGGFCITDISTYANPLISGGLLTAKIRVNSGGTDIGNITTATEFTLSGTSVGDKIIVGVKAEYLSTGSGGSNSYRLSVVDMSDSPVKEDGIAYLAIGDASVVAMNILNESGAIVSGINELEIEQYTNYVNFGEHYYV